MLVNAAYLLHGVAENKMTTNYRKQAVREAATVCPRPPQVGLESGVTSVPSLPRPLCSRLRPDIRDRQTSDAHHRLIPPTLRAGIIATATSNYNMLSLFIEYATIAACTPHTLKWKKTHKNTTPARGPVRALGL